MPYAWGNEVEALSGHLWYNYRDLQTALNFVRFKSFTVKASRDIIRATLENVRQVNPFTKDDRFPDTGVYIDMNHSVPNAYLTQILSALDFADRQNEKGRVVHDKLEERFYSNFEDSKVAYMKGLYGLMDLGHSRAVEKLHVVGIYVRNSFEAEWTKWS